MFALRAVEQNHRCGRQVLASRASQRAPISPAVRGHGQAAWPAVALRNRDRGIAPAVTYSPSDAPVAAPTTWLPEDPGGIRNWDYRYAWPRDASIGIGAFPAPGKTDEARLFLGSAAACQPAGPAPPARAAHARRQAFPAETRARRVARVRRQPARAPRQRGGAAAPARRLRLMSVAPHERRHRLGSETWRAMRGFAGEVARRWSEPDAGIGDPRRWRPPCPLQASRAGLAARPVPCA